ncbi:MAG: LysM peptidoglycan-binding domain-containing protein, partial [Anaerolineaceae bacterium]
MGDAMIIHVVKQGETVRSIAELYGKPVERLILENGITDADNLTIGETLVILYPELEYTIKDGDTLEAIARNHNTTIMELLRNNPYLSNRVYIYPSEVIVIKYDDERIRMISTNGFAYPFVNIDILKKTLPFLTYLTVYTYYYTSQGEIFNINDDEIIRIAKTYGVAPIMMLSGYSNNQEEEIEVTHNILINEDAQNILINNLIIMLLSKGYYGLNFKTPYIRPEDRLLYTEFIEKLSTRLHSAGFVIFVTLTMSVFELLSNIKYVELQYDRLGQLVDKLPIMSYEFVFTFGISPSVVAFETINNVLVYLTEIIPAEKIVTGLTTIGHIFKLPYLGDGARGQSISYDSAITLAREVGAEILYDDVTKASYFQYISQYEYIVRFRDARGVDAVLSLIP